MSTLTEPKVQQTDTATPGPRRRRRTFDRQSLPARYGGQMLYFMGAALIAGAVVHYPIDPPLYAAICSVGALVFLLGTIVNEFLLAEERPVLRQAIPLVCFSLLLSFGVGMVGGGIQHFEAFPERSAAMTPIGLVLSYVAFVAKDPKGRWGHLFGRFAAAVLLVTALTWFGMSALADSMGAHDHNHGSGASSEPSAPAPDQNAPADAPANRADAPADHAEAPAGDGHSSHQH